MAHPRIEEIEDDDSMQQVSTDTDRRFTAMEEDKFDDDMDFELPDLPVPPRVPLPTQHDSHDPRSPHAHPHAASPQDINYVQDTAQFKGWCALYPIYFDARRTTKHGRRIAKQNAVRNPLAKTIADACKLLGFSIVFEPQKSHPADWSNPGRVRVEFFDAAHKPTHRTVRTKGALLNGVAQYLRRNPTTEDDPFKVPVPGMGRESKRAAIPKGATVNEIVPLHSPAMGGGGVNSDQLQSMMGGMFPGMASMMGGGPEEDAGAPGPSQTTSQAQGAPKKPKMKRQIIR